MNNHHIKVYDYDKSESSLDMDMINIKDLQNEIGDIDLLKIDCEGGEHSIFEQIDFNRIGYLMCEFHTFELHGNPTFKPFYKWVIEVGKYMDFLYKERNSVDTFNFVAVNEKYWENR